MWSVRKENCVQLGDLYRRIKLFNPLNSAEYYDGLDSSVWKNEQIRFKIKFYDHAPTLGEFCSKERIK